MLDEILARNARRYPDKTGLVFKESRFTFSELNERVNRLTNALSALGVKKGDRMAIVADTCPQHIEAFFAGIKGGTATTMLNPGLNPQELTYLINNAEINTVVLGENYKGLINSLRPEIGCVKNFIIVGGPHNDMKGYDALITNSSPAEPVVQSKDDDLLFLACSGGTTGLQKQIMHTHRSIMAIMLDAIWAYRVAHDDVFLFATAPFWGVTIPLLVLPHFYMGCPIIMIEDTAPKSLLETIQQEKITNTFFGSPFLSPLLDYPDLNRFDYSTLRHILVAGSPLPAEVWQLAIKTFGKIFVQFYGASELPPITFLLPEDFVLEGAAEKVSRLRSCGREALNTRARVVDERGQDVSPGVVGEVIAKSKSLMKGYWNAPKATEAAIRGEYYYTGDMATIDEEGYVYLVGRKKDVITSRGKILSPAEIEDIIYRHPAVQEVAVIGAPDEELGEAVTAVIVLKTGLKTTQSEIMELCSQHLPPHAVPQSVDFITSLPKSPVGKVLKHKLRERYA